MGRLGHAIIRASRGLHRETAPFDGLVLPRRFPARCARPGNRASNRAGTSSPSTDWASGASTTAPWVTGRRDMQVGDRLDSIGGAQGRHATVRRDAAPTRARRIPIGQGLVSATGSAGPSTDHMDQRGRDPSRRRACPTTPGSGIFRGLHLPPRGLEGDYDCSASPMIRCQEPVVIRRRSPRILRIQCPAMM